MRCVFDIEANGLRFWKGEVPPADRVWCGVFYDLDSKEVHKFTPDDLDAMFAFMRSCTLLIGHNIIDYDLPLVTGLYGITITECEFVDTYLLSQLLEPDRKKHPNCPSKKGPHGLDNWGAIFGREKPEHEDWSKFSGEMLYRCEQDVVINRLTYLRLLKELGEHYA